MTCRFFQRFPHCLGALATTLLALCPASAADAAKIRFDLPADVVANSIRTFARQSSQEVLISAELGRGTLTQPVKGEFTPREAVDRMLVRTGLVAQQDAKTGALVIMPAAGPDADTTPSLKKKAQHQPPPPSKP